MKVSPFIAKGEEDVREGSLDARDLGSAEAVALTQPGRAIGAMQDEHRFAVRSSDVDMRGSMIVRVDDHAQAIEAVYGRHDVILHKPNRLG
ncbi:hypothetical protein WT08_00865 [Burkholderia sp. MSMB1552]|nr:MULTISPECIES: hypothetical protein [Burkholderia]ALX44694.1 hypothetical protein AQ610_19390 [Burkholderia humptydooensis]KVN19076.1 hypothetical protein WT08_00865 [Burkholderia sp. MSMB1552]KWZ46905.1 hypothetical protein WS92_29615 [Burkholderia sp. MSMB1588]